MKKRRTDAPEEPAHEIVSNRAATPAQQRLEKLRADANHCARMSETATDPSKRKLFRGLAEQLALEALELEQIVKDQ